MPKNAIPRSIINVNKKRKDTFSPEDINSIPRISMFRYLVRCSSCDFVTKVRQNLLKHLQLHSKMSAIPAITPINRPPCLERKNFKRMTSEVELENRLITDEDMALMPKLIQENHRYKCCSPDCNYITIDDVMLTYHIQALHPEYLDYYVCPHCQDDDSGIQYGQELEFHLRCHGELLFKCGYCHYYHWQKRTAEKHVTDKHPNKKPFVRDVRADKLAKEKLQNSNAPEEEEEVPSNVPVPDVLPYRCGLCDFAHENLDGIKSHSNGSHELNNQFKCAVCAFYSDSKSDIENHHEIKHPSIPFVMVKIYYVEQATTTDINLEPKLDPLWRRDMPGLKHIRGILYEDEIPSQPNKSKTDEEFMQDDDEDLIKSGNTKKTAAIDDFPMNCKECNLMKKTIKGLKMHIKLSHLRKGKFICNYCHFSSNMSGSMTCHIKNKHPDINETDYGTQKCDSNSKLFTHEYWKTNWGIPTLNERKEMVNKRKIPAELSPETPMKKKAKKQGIKRKIDESSENEIPANPPTNPIEGVSVEKKSNKEVISEISPFELVPTFKCGYCPKRTQNLIRIERHLETEHPNKDPIHKLMSRDQVVDLITSFKSSSNYNDYFCFYCETIGGNILELKTHFETHHTDDLNLKVVKSLPINGYLECSICGYLSAGFEKSEQRMHYHEEHPLEENYNFHKYVLKINKNLIVCKTVDLTKFNGELMLCPRGDCDFETKTLSAMNGHLRKHTQTFKCGHCGKTHVNSSEFHRHSAMAHGDKIPDLVKDPKAEAEFEALRALLEAYLLNLNLNVPNKETETKKPRNVATKSSGRRIFEKCPTARKRTGGGTSFYGFVSEKIDLNAISTEMSMGDMKIPIQVQKMADIVNLKPKLVLTDVKKS